MLSVVVTAKYLKPDFVTTAGEKAFTVARERIAAERMRMVTLLVEAVSCDE
jgi:hypothetical protein